MKPSYVFVLDGTQVVGVDDASGGYPYLSEVLGNAKFFNSPEEAETYRGVFYKKSMYRDEMVDYAGSKRAKDWVLYEVKLVGGPR